MSEATRFVCVVSKVQTLADGGIRVAFDLPETATLQAAELMEYKRWQMAVDITVTALKNTKDHDGIEQVETRRKRKSEWQASEVAGTDRDIDEGRG